MTPLTRRQMLAELIAAGALVMGGCRGGKPRINPAPSGSTLSTTWGDPIGDGQLRPAPGEPLSARTELGSQAAPVALLATLAQITDAHVLDPSSPARVAFLDRFGPPFQSTFRPHETLTTQLLAGAARAVRRLRADAVVEGGDLIDNDQRNELDQALAVLSGGRVKPGSGPGGYFGVQSPANPDPFYYRPDIDAPRHPGLLRAAVRPFASPGLGAPWYPVLGDHDVLVAGEVAPTPLTRQLALGDRALWEPPSRLTVPASASLRAGASPDGPPDPRLVDGFLAQALAWPTVRVPADPARVELDAAEVVARLRSASAHPGAGGDTLDYVFDLGAHVRVIVLDLARRGGGSGGLVHPGQAAWLEQQLSASGGRWLLVVSHQPLASSEGGAELLALLDRQPRVLAALAGHTHRNRISPRPSAAGGYWLINTASLIDYPQQARALRIVATSGGGAAVQTWMLDHFDPGGLGPVARQLAYIDAQGGRAAGFAGTRADRNVTLYRAPPRSGV